MSPTAVSRNAWPAVTSGWNSPAPARRRWSIWWLDGRYPGNLDTPMVGSFAKGVGTFYVDDQFNGKPIRVRFLWTLPNPQKPRWEQAFSTDSGATWETNWVMDFTRRA